MLSRFVSTGVAALAFTAGAAAQSTVKPLPQATMPTSFLWSLAARGSAAYTSTATARTTPDAGERDADAQIPPTSLEAHRDARPALDASDEDAPHVDLEIHGAVNPSADFQHSPGSVATARAGWDARLGWKTGDEQGLTVNLHTEATFYRFVHAPGLVPGTDEPLNDVYETSLGTTYCTQYSKRTSWFNAAALTLAGEDNASIGKALTLSAVSGVRYQAHPDLSLECGLAVVTLHEASPWVIPYLGFDWQISDSWRLATQGPKVSLSVDLGRHWTLAADAEYRLREYRLNDDNPVPAGVLRDQEIDLGGTLGWHPKQGIDLRFSTGITAWRELDFYDRDGGKLSETEMSPAPYASFSLTFGF